MNRRDSLRLIATTAIASGAAMAGCQPEDKPKTAVPEEPQFHLDRTPAEVEHEKSLLAKGPFFNDHEMATITVLADIIIPRDDVSGSASDAKVPEFIDFIVRDMPQHQVPLRGGLRWLDMQCLKRYDKSFKDLAATQQIEMVDQVAYPERAKGNKVLAPGVAFFSLLRNLVATGFYTSEIGVKDIGYAGNRANKWNGVPADVLKQYNMAYTDKELKECISFEETNA